MKQTSEQVRIQNKDDVLIVLLDIMSAILETLHTKQEIDPEMARVEIGFLQVSTEAARVYLDHCDSSPIEPDDKLERNTRRGAPMAIAELWQGKKRKGR